MSIKITQGRKIKKELDVFCRSCRAITKHLVLSGIDIDNTFIDYHDNHGKIETHRYDDCYILQCGGCKNIVFRKTHYFDEDICMGEDCDIHEEIYPNPHERVGIIDDIPYINDEIRSIYTETILAYNHNQPILTAIGIRAVIEAICEEQGVEGKNLFKKIDNLIEKKILTPSQSDILHRLRDLGNDAVHERKVYDADQLSLALDVVNHLIEGVYILPHRVKYNLKVDEKR